MLTLAVYIINCIVMAIFAVKTIAAVRKSYNPFLFYFTVVAFTFFLSFAVYTALVGYSIVANLPVYLFWADYFGRLIVYIGSVIAVQIPLYKLLSLIHI